MKSKYFLTILIILSTLTACGKEDPKAQDSHVTKSKGLFSTWSTKDGAVISLIGGDFGVNKFKVLTKGGYCEADLIIAGTEESGSAVRGSMTYFGTDTTVKCPTDPITVTYTKTADTLTLCKGGECEAYR